MQKLNLPPYNANIKSDNGRNLIFDVLRGKYVALTPEEWVRQNFVQYLINYKNYSRSLMNNEIPLRLNGTSKRCDTVVFSNTAVPKMIIEYKAPEIKITQKVFNQITRYNMVLKVDYLVVSNGLNHYCCKMDYENQGYIFLEDVPDFSVLLNE
ncbi:MAG: hypothetical protein BHV77_18375 [Bacteroides sp. 43_108]|nr:MAG: hypothetical protein BHV77_18375 [Bacteroides sp. 43_108]